VPPATAPPGRASDPRERDVDAGAASGRHPLRRLVRLVLIVEDIIDSGNTLQYLLDLLGTRKPNSIKICTLLDKPDRRVTEVNVDYTGFQIPDKFVVGYGLDYAQKYRNLPYIGVIE
jgi:hypoxanthine phosphoribosyltransferase